MSTAERPLLSLHSSFSSFWGMGEERGPRFFFLKTRKRRGEALLLVLWDGGSVLLSRRGREEVC